LRNASPVKKSVLGTTKSPVSARRSDYSSPSKGTISSSYGRARTSPGLDSFKGQKLYEERRAALLKQIENSRIERSTRLKT